MGTEDAVAVRFRFFLAICLIPILKQLTPTSFLHSLFRHPRLLWAHAPPPPRHQLDRRHIAEPHTSPHRTSGVTALGEVLAWVGHILHADDPARVCQRVYMRLGL